MKSRELALFLLSLGLVVGCGGKAIDESGTGGGGNTTNSTRGSGSASDNDSSGSGNGSQSSSSSGSGGTVGDDDVVSVTVVSSGVTSGGITTSSITASGGTTTGASMTSGGMPGYEILLQPIDGWVSADDNDAGIEGAFWIATDNDDGGSAIINPSSFDTQGPYICVDGTAEQVLDMEYSVYWGAMVGFNLNQEADGTASPYNALARGITGFSFDISALPIGGQIRFGAQVYGETDTYCKPVVSTTGNQVRWEDLQRNCWAPEGITPDPSLIQSIYWQIVTNDSAVYDFAFCITNLVALTD